MPEPSPVPSVIITKSFMPRALPNTISPMAAAFASLVTIILTPGKCFDMSATNSNVRILSGRGSLTSSKRQRLAGVSILPVWMLALGAPTPMPISSQSSRVAISSFMAEARAST